jgi:hypothetical protein
MKKQVKKLDFKKTTLLLLEKDHQKGLNTGNRLAQLPTSGGEDCFSYLPYCNPFSKIPCTRTSIQ